MQYFLIFLLCQLFIINASFSQSLPTFNTALPFSSIQGEFTKISERNEVADTITSSFYFVDKPYMYILTRAPHYQIMVIDKNLTTIYYPKRQLAYRLKSENTPLLPAVNFLIIFFNAEEGLTNLGFQLEKQDIIGDTLISTWKLPNSKKPIGKFQLIQVDDKLIEVTYTSPDTSVINLIDYKDFSTIDNLTFPMTIISETILPNEYSMETYRFKNIKIDLPIPEEYLNFSLPEKIKVVEKEW